MVAPSVVTLTSTQVASRNSQGNDLPQVFNIILTDTQPQGS